MRIETVNARVAQDAGFERALQEEPLPHDLEIPLIGKKKIPYRTFENYYMLKAIAEYYFDFSTLPAGRKEEALNKMIRRIAVDGKRIYKDHILTEDEQPGPLLEKLLVAYEEYKKYVRDNPSIYTYSEVGDWNKSFFQLDESPTWVGEGGIYDMRPFLPYSVFRKYLKNYLYLPTAPKPVSR